MRAAVLALLALPLALSGCKTLEAVTSEISGQKTYQSVPGRFLDVAHQRRVASGDNDQVTQLGEALSGRKAEVVRGLDGGTQLPQQIEELQGAEPLRRYAEGILARLLAGWPHDAPKIRVVVSTSPAYGARVHPGNVLELYQGTLVNGTSEDELAFILAHEAAHILLNHLDADRYHEARAKLEDSVITAGLVALSQRSDAKSEKDGKRFGAAALAYAAYKELQEKFLRPSWDRQQEDEADLLGHDLLHGAGYNNAVYQTVMQRMESDETKKEEEKLEEHRRREREITDLVESGQAGAGINAAFARLREAPTVIYGQLIDAVAKKHNSPLRRLEDLDAYVLREELLENANLTLKEQPYQAAVLQGPGLRALARSVLAQRADALIGRNLFAEAEELLKLAMKDGFEGDPQLRTSMARLHAGQGRIDLAIQDLEVAVRSPAATEEAFGMLLAHLSTAGRPAQALTVLDRMESRFGGAEANYPRRMALLFAAGRPQDGLAVLERCRALKGSPVVRHCTLVAQEFVVAEQRRQAGVKMGG
jgi:predicted Zn-dependent protease